MNAQLAIITDRGALGRVIAGIKRAGAKLDANIHKAAVSCLFHAREHGDITLLTRLAAAMPKSSRRKALLFWAARFAPVKFSEEEQAFTLKKQREATDFDLEAAAETPFWDLTNEKEPAPFDIERFLKGLTRSLKKGYEQGRVDVHTFDRIASALPNIRDEVMTGESDEVPAAVNKTTNGTGESATVN